MREQQRRALLHIVGEFVRVDVALQLVRRQHHHDIGPFARPRRRIMTLKPRLPPSLRQASPGAAPTHDVLHAGVAQVQRMGVALAAIADDGDLLALDRD